MKTAKINEIWTAITPIKHRSDNVIIVSIEGPYIIFKSIYNRLPNLSDIKIEWCPFEMHSNFYSLYYYNDQLNNERAVKDIIE